MIFSWDWKNKREIWQERWVDNDIKIYICDVGTDQLFHNSLMQKY